MLRIIGSLDAEQQHWLERLFILYVPPSSFTCRDRSDRKCWIAAIQDPSFFVLFCFFFPLIELTLSAITRLIAFWFRMCIRYILTLCFTIFISEYSLTRANFMCLCAFFGLYLYPHWNVSAAVSWITVAFSTEVKFTLSLNLNFKSFYELQSFLLGPPSKPLYLFQTCSCIRLSLWWSFDWQGRIDSIILAWTVF